MFLLWFPLCSLSGSLAARNSGERSLTNSCLEIDPSPYQSSNVQTRIVGDSDAQAKRKAGLSEMRGRGKGRTWEVQKENVGQSLSGFSEEAPAKGNRGKMSGVKKMLNHRIH